MLSQNKISIQVSCQSLSTCLYRHGHDMGNCSYRMEDVDMVQHQVEEGEIKNSDHDFS